MIKELKEMSIKNYKISRIRDIIQNSRVEYKPICEQVDSVKDFILFNMIYYKTSGQDQQERFKEALSN